MEKGFVLVFWVMMGWRFDQMELPGLYQGNCAAYRDEVLRERSPSRAECVPEPRPRTLMPTYQNRLNDRCFICGPPPDQPPPGHKRI
jgi:hypothetical protein